MNKNVSIFYRKDRDCWAVQCCSYDSNNKKKVTTKSFKEKEDADRYYEKMMVNSDNQSYIIKNGVTLRTMMITNLEKKTSSETISEGQIMRILKTIKQFPNELLNKDIGEIDEKELQDYLNSLKNYSNSTIKKFYEQLSQAFRKALDRDYIRINPMKNVIRPKSNKKDKKVRALTIAEQEMFTDFLIDADINKVPYKNVFLFQMYLGLRVGECLALRRTDIDLLHNFIKVENTMSVDKHEKIIIKNTPKSFNGQREIPLPNFLKPYIIEQMQLSKEKNHIEKLLFVNGNGKYVDHRGANKILKKLLKENFNIEDISTHSLRHTYGTRCSEGGMREVALQKLMGHGSVEATLNTYVDVTEEYTEDELSKLYDYYNISNIMTEEIAQ